MSVNAAISSWQVVVRLQAAVVVVESAMLADYLVSCRLGLRVPLIPARAEEIEVAEEEDSEADAEGGVAAVMSDGTVSSSDRRSKLLKVLTRDISELLRLVID